MASAEVRFSQAYPQSRKAVEDVDRWCTEPLPASRLCLMAGGPGMLLMLYLPAPGVPCPTVLTTFTALSWLLGGPGGHPASGAPESTADVSGYGRR